MLLFLSQVDAWPQRRDDTFYYDSSNRECQDCDVHKVKVYNTDQFGVVAQWEPSQEHPQHSAGVGSQLAALLFIFEKVKTTFIQSFTCLCFLLYFCVNLPDICHIQGFYKNHGPLK